MMKKMLFLMLFLLILGAANLSAQVRIGGNGVPNTAAVLDLNTTDTDNAGTKGLALPRVSLDTTNTKLNGATPVNGMVVYNTNATMKGGQGAGVYVWVSNKWSQLVPSVPVTSITLNKSNLNLPVGYNWTPTITYAPANATNQTVTWSSSNTGVATVNASGQITGVAVGTAVITAKANDGGNASRTVNVNVWQRTVQTVSMGGSNYAACAIPNLGTWLTEPSRAGVPDTVADGLPFYSLKSAAAACVAPWRCAGPDTAQLMATFLQDSPGSYRHYTGIYEWAHSGFFAGKVRNEQAIANNIIVGLERPDAGVRAFRNALRDVWIRGGLSSEHAAPVVCVRD